MPLILALDQGTTSSRAIVFDASGTPVARQGHEFKQHYPEPGWVVHDAMEIWDSQLRAARGALTRAKVRPEDLSAIGITNQRETTVVWDRHTGRPLHRAIVWQDCRSDGGPQRARRRGAAAAVSLSGRRS